MPDAYKVLGLDENVDDETIRQRYLQLVRECPPEQHPERFAAVRHAYEKIRTRHDRALYHLFRRHNEVTIESIIEELACHKKRTRYSLKALTTAYFSLTNH